jgi:hypothetical protein
MNDIKNQIVMDILGKFIPTLGKEIEDKLMSLGLGESHEFNALISIAASIVGTIVNNFTNPVTKDLASVILSSTIMNQFHSVVIEANKSSNNTIINTKSTVN